MTSGAPVYATFETFSPEGDPVQVSVRWTEWIESFEDYLAVLEITEPEEKLRHLRHHVGTKNQRDM